MITQEKHKFILNLTTVTQKVYTDEQKAFMCNFNKPTISFSDPGSGKTMSAISGLVVAELCDGIKGEDIYALSFTNVATNELETRHKELCRKLGIRQNVNFLTFHKICLSILGKYHDLIDIWDYQVKSYSIAETLRLIKVVAENRDLDLSKFQARAILDAILKLNASLIFDNNRIRNTLVFKNTNLKLDDFNYIRKRLYLLLKTTGCMSVDMICLYTLEILRKYKHVSEEFKSKCKLMLIDEFQSMSLLYIKIVSLLSDNVIAIGDMKQQIYGFNGACRQVVQQYMTFYPNADRIDLTQSFRCRDEIADFATEIILKNEIGGQDFKGIGKGGKVTIHKGFSYRQAVELIKEKYEGNHSFLENNYLFLYRNNIFAIPLVEELYKNNIPFKIDKYTTCDKIPVINDLCALTRLVYDSYDIDNYNILAKLFPELSKYKGDIYNSIFAKILNDGNTIFTKPYEFQQNGLGTLFYKTAKRVKNCLDNKEVLKTVFNIWYDFYTEIYLNAHKYYFEHDVDYYIRMSSSLVAVKAYETFINDEYNKLHFIEESLALQPKVQLRTFHSAIGTEADIVYILNADDGIIPNISKVKELKNRACYEELTELVANEYNLCYVACTRAKNELHISYDSKLSPIFEGDNLFKIYELEANNSTDLSKDIEAFKEFSEFKKVV